jgi:hypothetical protein
VGLRIINIATFKTVMRKGVCYDGMRTDCESPTLAAKNWSAGAHAIKERRSGVEAGSYLKLCASHWNMTWAPQSGRRPPGGAPWRQCKILDSIERRLEAPVRLEDLAKTASLSTRVFLPRVQGELRRDAPCQTRILSWACSTEAPLIA